MGVDLFLYFFIDWNFIQRISRITKRNQPYPVISPFAIDNVPSLNNSMFGDFVDLIYPIELEIKVTINTARSNS